MLDLGVESVRIPVRVKFEFNLENGALVSNSLSYRLLYNRQLLEKRYPQLQPAHLDQKIDKTVRRKIYVYLKDHGYVSRNRPLEKIKISDS